MSIPLETLRTEDVCLIFAHRHLASPCRILPCLPEAIKKVIITRLFPETQPGRTGKQAREVFSLSFPFPMCRQGARAPHKKSLFCLPGGIPTPAGALKHNLSLVHKKSHLCFGKVHSCRQGGIGFHPSSKPLLHKQNCTSVPDTFLYQAKLHFTLHSLFSLGKGGRKTFLIKNKNIGNTNRCRVPKYV